MFHLEDLIPGRNIIITLDDILDENNDYHAILIYKQRIITTIAYAIESDIFFTIHFDDIELRCDIDSAIMDSISIHTNNGLILAAASCNDGKEAWMHNIKISDLMLL